MCIALASLSKELSSTVLSDECKDDHELDLQVKDRFIDFPSQNEKRYDDIDTKNLQKTNKDCTHSETASSTILPQLEEKNDSKLLNHVVSIGGIALRGYLMTNILSKDEISLLKVSVLNSLLQYYILGTKSTKDNPANSSYTGLACKEAERLIWFMDGLSEVSLCHMWEETGLQFIDAHR